MSNSKINKVLFDIALPGEEKEMALKKAKDLFYDKVMKVVEQELDRYNGTISITKMELDLGALPEDELEIAVRAAIKKELQNQPSSAGDIYQNLAANRLKNIDAQAQNIWSDTEHLMHFLQRGYWPWHIQNEPENVIQNFLTGYFKDHNKTAVLFQLLPHQSQYVVDRLWMLVFSRSLYKKLFLSALQMYHTFFDSFAVLLPPDYEKFIMKRSFAYSLILKLLKTSSVRSLDDAKQLLLEIFKEGYFNNDKWVSGIAENDTLLQQKMQSAKNMNEVKIVVDNVLKEQASAADQNLLSPAKKNIVLNEAIKKDTDNSVENQTHKGFQQLLTEEDGKITISNGGLILFHLYLPYIFKDLKWVDASNKFIDARKQQKAVHFLQYLIDGKSRHDEHVLVLNKMLCGWPIHLPLTLKCNFSQKEKAIATEAIDSLKEHWIVMKNTSAQGLMESFVKRQGIIQRNQSGYLLQIERKTIDVLLDSLPFGIGTIKLPWNEYIISTEW